MLDIFDDAIKGGIGKVIGRILLALDVVSSTVAICDSCSGAQFLVALETYYLYAIIGALIASLAALLIGGVGGAIVGIILGLIFSILLTAVINLMLCVCRGDSK